MPLLVVLAALLVLAFVNAFALRRLRDSRFLPTPKNAPFVSLLVPARNEAENLCKLLPTLMLQTHAELEVLVLNDNSSDDTARVVTHFARYDPRIRLLHGAPLPTGWLGKNWACHQLAQTATGELLVFTDADTVWSADAVLHIVKTVAQRRADALSAWPVHVVRPVLARLVQPIQQWSLLAFLPVPMVPNPRFVAAVAAIGQLMVFRRETYLEVGGHAAVRASVIEDMALARNVKKAGRRFVLCVGVGTLACEMYQSNQDVLAGFAKNTHAAFGAKPLATLAVVALFLGLYVAPWVWLVWALVFGQAWVWPACAVVLGLLPRVLSDWRFGYTPGLALLHPVSVLAWVVVALVSWRQHARGAVRWKDREYDLRNATTPPQETPAETPPVAGGKLRP